jgi:hypothetical protein
MLTMAGTLIFALILGCRSEDDHAAANVRNGSHPVLTVGNFVRIRQFILDQGQRRTYCNMFNHNPHWPFEEFNAYLNPPDQRNMNCELGLSEFNTLVIQADGVGPTQYWHITLDSSSNSLCIEQNYSTARPQRLKSEVATFFRKALAEIEIRSAAPGAAPDSSAPQGSLRPGKP